MPIYTKTGDKGTTSLYGGKRVLKSNILIEAYGSIDELSAFIGLATTKIKQKQDKLLLISIQHDLQQIMSYLSQRKINLVNLGKKIKVFEQIIDKTNLRLSKLTGFILSQGSEISCWFHVLRTVCRRTERVVVRTLNEMKIVQYLNRLSDLFFTLARKYNQNKEILI